MLREIITVIAIIVGAIFRILVKIFLALAAVMIAVSRQRGGRRPF